MATKRNVFWPDVSTLESAGWAIKQGIWAAVFVALITGIVASVALLTHKPILGVGVSGLLDAAIFAAVAQLGPKIEIRAVAVTNDHGVPCSPCGACRQVIYEFGPDAMVFFQGKEGPKQAHITDLLPEGFRLQ